MGTVASEDEPLEGLQQEDLRNGFFTHMGLYSGHHSSFSITFSIMSPERGMGGRREGGVVTWTSLCNPRKPLSRQAQLMQPPFLPRLQWSEVTSFELLVQVLILLIHVRKKGQSEAHDPFGSYGLLFANLPFDLTSCGYVPSQRPNYWTNSLVLGWSLYLRLGENQLCRCCRVLMLRPPAWLVSQGHDMASGGLYSNLSQEVSCAAFLTRGSSLLSAKEERACGSLLEV